MITTPGLRDWSVDRGHQARKELRIVFVAATEFPDDDRLGFTPNLPAANVRPH